LSLAPVLNQINPAYTQPFYNVTPLFNIGVLVAPSFNSLYQTLCHSFLYYAHLWTTIINNKNSMVVARERTITIKRHPLVGELMSTFADRGVSRSQRGGSPTAVLSVF
jgi:hypothetical protein